MTDYIVTARITVSGADRSQLQATLDAGTRELPGLASRYGVTVTDVTTSIDEA